jgi:hypothetical protein
MEHDQISQAYNKEKGTDYELHTQCQLSLESLETLRHFT